MKAVPLLLKTVLHESHIDTNVTLTSIRTKLSNLDTYVSTVGHGLNSATHRERKWRADVAERCDNNKGLLMGGR